jgi:hypothetical protein
MQASVPRRMRGEENEQFNYNGPHPYMRKFSRSMRYRELKC